MTQVNFSVSVTLEKTSGKFVAKDTLAEELRTEIDSAIASFTYSDEGEYEVTDYEINDA